MRLVLYILLFVPGFASGQMLLEESRVNYKHESQDDVILYAAQDCNHCYYYLPTDFRISTKQDGKPEASLIVWKNDSESEIIGGILHVLVTWGLTAEREKATREFVRSKVDSLATIMGPSTIKSTPETLVINGDDKLAKILKSSLSNVASAPVTSGSKTALSFRFDEIVIKDILYYVKNPAKTTTSLKATYAYEVALSSGFSKTKTVVLTLDFKEILQLVKNSK